jgi:hypothetical protein
MQRYECDDCGSTEGTFAVEIRQVFIGARIPGNTHLCADCAEDRVMDMLREIHSDE